MAAALRVAAARVGGAAAELRCKFMFNTLANALDVIWQSRSGGCLGFRVGPIVGVSAGVAAVESRAVIAVERQAAPQALG
jgi:hypothetical protein